MYDTIIIGNDLSSLVAALLSSRYGKKTALLSEESAPDLYAESGYTFNIDPTPWTGMGTGQVLLRLFSEVDIPVTGMSNVIQLNPSLQVILPEHRLDLYNERDSLISEMGREFPENMKEIINFYSAVLKSSNWVTRFINKNPFAGPRSYKEYLEFAVGILILIMNSSILSKNFRATQNPPSLKRVFEAEIRLLSNLCLEATDPLSYAYILSLPWKGLFYHIGGKHNLINVLRKKFASYGGSFINNISIVRLNTEGKIEVAIDVEGNISTLSATNLIVSTKWEKLKQMLLADRKFERLARKFESIEVAYYPFTLHMGVFGKGLPEKMSEYLIIIKDEEAPVTDNNLIFLEVSSPEDTVSAPHGKRAISATIFLEKSPLILSNGYLERTSACILDNLKDFLPFLKENIDFINVGKSIEISRRYQNIINQKYKILGKRLIGISTLSNSTPVDNVFLTGGMLLAGLGFEGEITSGMNAAYLTVGK